MNSYLSLIIFILPAAYAIPMFKQCLSMLSHDADRDVFHLIQGQGLRIIYHFLRIPQQTKGFCCIKKYRRTRCWEEDLNSPRRFFIGYCGRTFQKLRESFQHGFHNGNLSLCTSRVMFTLSMLHMLQFYTHLLYTPSGIHILVFNTARRWQHGKETHL